MSDRELLEAAARAAGMHDAVSCRDGIKYNFRVELGEQVYNFWNPLVNDGDALRLAVKLNIVVWECEQYNAAMAEARYGAGRGEYWEPVVDDRYAATRRAIVRAAAALGADK